MYTKVRALRLVDLRLKPQLSRYWLVLTSYNVFLVELRYFTGFTGANSRGLSREYWTFCENFEFFCKLIRNFQNAISRQILSQIG